MPFLLLINDQIEERGKTRKNHHPLAVVYVRHPHLLGHGLVVVSHLLGTRLQSRSWAASKCAKKASSVFTTTLITPVLHLPCHSSQWENCVSRNSWVCACMLSHLSCVQLCDPVDCSPPGSSVHGDSLGKNTGVGCHALLRRSSWPSYWIHVSYAQNRNWVLKRWDIAGLNDYKWTTKSSIKAKAKKSQEINVKTWNFSCSSCKVICTLGHFISFNMQFSHIGKLKQLLI